MEIAFVDVKFRDRRTAGLHVRYRVHDCEQHENVLVEQTKVFKVVDGSLRPTSFRIPFPGSLGLNSLGADIRVLSAGGETLFEQREMRLADQEIVQLLPLEFRVVVTNVWAHAEKTTFIPVQVSLPHVVLPLSKADYLGKFVTTMHCGSATRVESYIVSRVQGLETPTSLFVPNAVCTVSVTLELMSDTPFCHKAETGSLTISSQGSSQMQLRVLPTPSQLMLVDLVSAAKGRAAPEFQHVYEKQLKQLPASAFQLLLDKQKSSKIIRVLETAIRKAHSRRRLAELQQAYLVIAEQLAQNQAEMCLKYVTYKGVGFQDQPLTSKKITYESPLVEVPSTTSIVNSFLEPSHMCVQCIRGPARLVQYFFTKPGETTPVTLVQSRKCQCLQVVSQDYFSRTPHYQLSYLYQISPPDEADTIVAQFLPDVPDSQNVSSVCILMEKVWQKLNGNADLIIQEGDATFFIAVPLLGLPGEVSAQATQDEGQLDMEIQKYQNLYQIQQRQIDTNCAKLQLAQPNRAPIPVREYELTRSELALLRERLGLDASVLSYGEVLESLLLQNKFTLAQKVFLLTREVMEQNSRNTALQARAEQTSARVLAYQSYQITSFQERIALLKQWVDDGKIGPEPARKSSKRGGAENSIQIPLVLENIRKSTSM